MSSPQCREIRLELGAYVLGLLDAGDEQRVREHLERCVDCAAEAASLRATGSALTLTDLALVEQPPEPSPEVLPNLLQRVAAARRRRRITTSVAAAAAAVVVTLGGIALVDAVDDSPGDGVQAGESDGEPVVTASGREGSVAVTVDIWDRDWGSALTVDVSGVPAGYRCSLVAVGADGQRETAATWVVPSGGYNEETGLSMDGAHGLRHWEVDRYEVVTSDGELLVTLPVHG